MNTYTMVFAVTPDFKRVLLLRKSDRHHNPLFRDRWTVPGGKLESDETPWGCAEREFKEETQVDLYGVLRRVLDFPCNCDPLESEHEVIVYGITEPYERLALATGSEEPVEVFAVQFLPSDLVWCTQPLLALTLERLRQPI